METQVKTPIQEKRESLKKLSIIAKEMVEKGIVATINEGLIKLYKDEENQEFKLYNEWKKEGKQVIKGSKAFLVWGKPKEITNQEGKDNNSAEDDENGTFFPLCFLFSNKQVRDAD